MRKGDSFFFRGIEGAIDTNGDTIIPFIYRSLDCFVDNYFFAWDTLEKHCGIINMFNKVIVPFEYVPDLYVDDYVRRKFPKYLYSHYGVAVLPRSKKKGDFVLVDTTNTIIVKEGTYNDIESLNDEAINRFFAVTSPTGLMGIYDVKMKKESLPCEFSSFGATFSINKKTYFLDKGVMPAEKNGRWGLLDLETGKIIIPFEYETKSVTFDKDSVQDYFLLKKNGKSGIIDITGRTLTPFNYDEINETIKGFILVMNNGLYGLIDEKTKKEVLPPEYSKIIYDVHYENNRT
ncbi:MAG: WG repeat-containing protein, partial [Bacteroidota bacterium]